LQRLYDDVRMALNPFDLVFKGDWGSAFDLKAFGNFLADLDLAHIEE
jgi:hypothetical protein